MNSTVLFQSCQFIHNYLDGSSPGGAVDQSQLSEAAVLSNGTKKLVVHIDLWGREGKGGREGGHLIHCLQRFLAIERISHRFTYLHFSRINYVEVITLVTCGGGA